MFTLIVEPCPPPIRPRSPIVTLAITVPPEPLRSAQSTESVDDVGREGHGQGSPLARGGDVAEDGGEMREPAVDHMGDGCRQLHHVQFPTPEEDGGFLAPTVRYPCGETNCQYPLPGESPWSPGGSSASAVRRSRASAVCGGW